MLVDGADRVRGLASPPTPPTAGLVACPGPLHRRARLGGGGGRRRLGDLRLRSRVVVAPVRYPLARPGVGPTCAARRRAHLWRADLPGPATANLEAGVGLWPEGRRTRGPCGCGGEALECRAGQAELGGRPPSPGFC
jgi:hypothetical protein